MEIGNDFKENLAILKKVMTTVSSSWLTQVQEEDSIEVLLIKNNTFLNGGEIKLALRQITA